MPDILLVVSRWWKAILALTIVSLIIAFVIVMVQPKKYLSVVTAMPASAVAFDKARIFNTNIEGLYPTLGTPEDLDKIIATSVLDTIYLSIATEKGLVAHYESADVYNAAMNLKSNSKVMKSEYGDLKIKVWDKQPAKAAELANALFQKLQLLHQDLQNQTNSLILENLRKRQASIEAQLKDSAGLDPLTVARKQTKQQEVQQYDKMISEYEMMISTKPQVLLLVEPARQSSGADKPKVLPALLMALFASIVFGLILAFYLESKKR